MSTDLKNLIGLDRQELAREMDAIGEKPFRAKQLWHWIYHQGETDFSKMTTLAKSFRSKLAEHYSLERPQVSRELTSTDRARKWLLKFDDANEAESVFIPEDDRGALCISSQVGCTLTCAFCHTGTQKLVRNLTAREIVSQLMVARDSYSEWPSGRDDRLLTNIVMMGMGEPLFNFDNVAKALKIVMDGDGLSISKRRITLSTAGVVPMMERCGEELGVNLAVSLHACTDELRDVLVPINRKHPVRELLAACRAYPGANNARRITFEYAMLKGVNDSDADAHELIRLVRDVPAKFNLIPFNPWPGTAYECSTPKTIRRFAKILNDGGLSAPVRLPRGRDIMAACGQLKSDSERARRQSTRPDKPSGDTAPAVA
ncbi:MAG: 23S rRNA (adenine(2503)-C(2))-methyltransferase RlmN [Rhodospirillales bacterium]|nr:23S rRNA (adenine(2503)-C(2))-methyltransferase RlmN [Alphaproteobacteria bacterium]MBL6948447.1 23S rRNA (adenine(2503)-C(2))-methyltransferase RlmN [Rhodospirillales bacterium]